MAIASIKENKLGIYVRMLRTLAVDSMKATDQEDDLWNTMDEYLLVEILKKLSVRQLCRSRRVCKSWNSLISSVFFITHHHLVSAASFHSDLTYLVSIKSNEYKNDFSYAFYNPEVSVSDQHHTFRRVIYDDQPVAVQGRRPSLPPNLVDVVHGVVCIYRHRVESVVLWNPTINKYVEIPPSTHDQTLKAIGLGFDGVKKYESCFKVVTIRGVSHPSVRRPTPPIFEVFSTREKRWREVDAGHIDLHRVFITRGGCFSNGTIYWIVMRDLSKHHVIKNLFFLLMFECEREEFKTMELPEQFNRPEIASSRPLIYRGMLSVFMKLKDQSIHVKMDDEPKSELWAVEENGVARTWKKLDFDQGEDYVEIKGYVFEETMFLMDAESESMSFSERHDKDWCICYVKDA